MSRAVSGDHVLFEECIPMFRPEKIKVYEEGNDLYGYLLLDFELTESLHFEYFIIESTKVVILPGEYKAFISRVKLPKWFEWEHDSYLFTIGLASVISFVSGRPVKSPRDGYTSSEELDQQTLSELAIKFPIISSGTGTHDIRLSNDSHSKLKENLHEIMILLYSVPYELYKTVMQSIRLVHLAHLNKREDFGLGYYLLVSAVEPIATEAIKRKKVAGKNQLKKEWKEIAKTDEVFRDLLEKYQNELSKNRYIGTRFVEFIMNYCPPTQWFDLKHPRENLMEYIGEISGRSQDSNIKKKWYEIYPDDLSDVEIRAILSDVYVHRSKFTHEGKNPPHRRPNSSNRFFDKEFIDEYVDGEYRYNEIVLPNFQLISFIANRSILNFLKEKAKIK
ncbi:hypothetical protein ACFY5J_27050 [Peribacillus butanolivorans]|uniref:hypothetical protein n=1 Tax=Peribacillus butanolivorans TaxID=421767 RepID=UPI0036B7CDCA